MPRVAQATGCDLKAVLEKLITDVGGSERHPMGGYFGEAPLNASEALRLEKLALKHGIDPVSEFKKFREQYKSAKPDNSLMIDGFEVTLDSAPKKK